MGIFSKSSPKPSLTPPSDLEERVRKMESSLRQLEDDFVDLWDRQRRRIGREAKREARENPPAPSTADELSERIRAMRRATPFNQQEH